MKTANFVRQHEDILEIVGEITGLMNIDSLASKSEDMVSLLRKFTGKLEAHLVMEDNVLYPKLFKHESSEVRKIAQEFFDEMGGLKIVLGQWFEKWTYSGSIASEPKDFIEETQGIFSALAPVSYTHLTLPTNREV